MGDFTNLMWMKNWTRPREGWRKIHRTPDGCAFVNNEGHEGHDAMTVIISGAREEDGKRWVHLSVARPDRLPSYHELVAVKETFIGAERKAISVFAPRSEHVNIHEYCLHLWHCVDGDPLPDFTGGGATL